MATSVYQQGGYGTAGLFPDPIIAPRDPTTSDKVSPTGQPYQVFQGWNNALTDACFIYLGNGNWASLAAVTGTVTQLTGDSGTALPSGGSIKIAGGSGVVTSASGSTVTISLTGGGVAIDSFAPDAGTNPVVPTAAGLVTMAGTANQITTTGGLNSLTFSIPATFIAPGSIASTTTITAATGLTVTAGGAAITGTTTINTSGAGVTTIGTGGSGAVNIGNATGNTAVTGSLTASTTLTATLGNITATNGNLVLGTLGNKIVIPTGLNASVGTSAAMSGTPGAVTVATTASSATAKIFYSRATAGGTLGNVSITAQDGTGFTLTSTANETSTFNWWIINA